MENLHKAINHVVDFLEPNFGLANCHMVNFITHDWFSNLLPSDCQESLLKLTDAELSALPSGKLFEEREARDDERSLEQFLAAAKSCTLEALLSDTSLLRSYDSVCSNVHKARLDYQVYMQEKKSHEVEHLAFLIAQMCVQYGISQVVDFGSGRGYLGSLLALLFGLDVLGLDSSDNNTHSAQRRQENLSKHWAGVLTRMQKSQAEAGMASTSQNASCTGRYRALTENVSECTDLDSVMKAQGMSAERVFECGLHACGDLTSHAIEAFVRSSRCSVLCIVGCCYHLMEERFFANPYHHAGEPPVSYAGFPLSRYLIDRSMKLGRNARTLAAQPVFRIAEQNAMPNKSLYWRALLQKIIVDHDAASTPVLEKKVGRIAAKCHTFSEYAAKAFTKLEISLNLDQAQIDDACIRYAEYSRKMDCFYQYRCALAPCVEALIVLDRLLFLVEQVAVKDAYVIPIFDPCISPRCYALIANKQTTIATETEKI